MSTDVENGLTLFKVALVVLANVIYLNLSANSVTVKRQVVYTESS